jgi:hypothetical protein
MTAIIVGVSFGSMVDSRGGLRAGSSPISWRPLIGRGPVMGWEPVQRTSRLEDTVEVVDFSSWALTLTFQLLDYWVSADRDEGTAVCGAHFCP